MVLTGSWTKFMAKSVCEALDWDSTKMVVKAPPAAPALCPLYSEPTESGEKEDIAFNPSSTHVVPQTGMLQQDFLKQM